MLEFRFPIRHHECDAYGHLNNVSYVRYLEEALLQGDAGRRMFRLTMDYLRPARFGETVELRMTPESEDDRSVRWACDFHVTGSADRVATASVETIALLEVVQGAMDALPPLRRAAARRVRSTAYGFVARPGFDAPGVRSDDAGICGGLRDGRDRRAWLAARAHGRGRVCHHSCAGMTPCLRLPRAWVKKLRSPPGSRTSSGSVRCGITRFGALPMGRCWRALIRWGCGLTSRPAGRYASRRISCETSRRMSQWANLP